jgi:aminoglycoside 6'-N-acetyltransferase
VVRGELTVVRPATEADADLLVAWHADPEVSRFWDDETFTRQEMLARLARPDVESFLVEAAGEPVGFIQAWRADDEPLRGGLDMFLVPAARGRGLGPDAARSLAAHLLSERGWAGVTVDPYLWNERAIAGWRKAGFLPVAERPCDDEHREGWLLMGFGGGLT